MTGLRTLAPILFLAVAVVVVSLVFLSEPDELPPDPGPVAPRSVDHESRRRPREPSSPPVTHLTPAVLTGVVHAEPNPVDAGAWIAISAPGQELRVPLDAEGRFTFHEVPADVTLTVWVGPSSDGAHLYCLTQELVLKPGERREIEFKIRLGNVIRGRVVTKEGKPVPRVRVAVLPPAADWRATAVRVATTTDEQGRFYVGVKGYESQGLRRLVVDAVGRGYILEELLIEPPEMEMGQEILVKLEMGLVIAGRAFGPEGQPLAGATVHLLEEYDGDPLKRRPVEGRVRTDETGRFKDDAYRPGIYRIFLEGRTKAGPVALVQQGVRAGDEEVELRVGAGGRLEIAFVSDTTGEAVVPSEASVEFVWGHTGEEEHYVPWCELEGKDRYVLTDLPPGHYRIGAHHPGYETLFSDLLPFGAGNRAKVTFRMKPR